MNFQKAVRIVVAFSFVLCSTIVHTSDAYGVWHRNGVDAKADVEVNQKTTTLTFEGITVIDSEGVTISENGVSVSDSKQKGGTCK